jgi:hypothetical protein
LLILNNLAAGVDRPALPTNLSNAAWHAQIILQYCSIGWRWEESKSL